MKDHVERIFFFLLSGIRLMNIKRYINRYYNVFDIQVLYRQRVVFFSIYCSFFSQINLQKNDMNN